jgi:type II secretory pathway pseudopilin PulG
MRREASRRGLSRPEAVLLLGLLVFVLSLVVPGWFLWVQRRQVAMARADLRALVDAAQTFYAEYGTWPTALSGGLEDVHYGRELPNREVINILRAWDAPGNLGQRVNKRKISFLEVPEYRPGWSGLAADGNLMDPWGQPYQLLLDASLDNVCLSPTTVYGRREGEGVMVWSCGPDGLSDTRDDILSWQPR